MTINKSHRPNILWLMTDEQRADSVGYSGTPWAHTPNLDRLASTGTRFHSAYTPSPVCVSARACLLTGRYGSSTGVMNNHHALVLEDPEFLTWNLAARGYQVASFGKHHYNCARQAFDVEYNHVLGDRVHYFRYLEPAGEDADIVRYDTGRSPWLFAGRFPGAVEQTPEMENVAQALRWFSRRDPHRPFFLRLSFNAPHTPVVTPPPFDTLIDPADIDLPLHWSDDMEFASPTHRDYYCDYAGTHRLDHVKIQRLRQCYYGHVAFVDYAFGVLLDALQAQGALDNTIVVFVSDHGTHLGDHGFMQKQSYFEASATVPYFFAGPGIADQDVHTPVNIGSLLPTLMDLAGIDIPSQVQFESLAPGLCEDAALLQAPIFAEIDHGIWGYRDGDRYVMLRDGRYKLMLYRDPRDPQRYLGSDDRVLFDLETDPGEMRNLANDPDYAMVMIDLIAKLDAWDASRPIREATLVSR